jgi:hypothetical protein
MRLTSKEVLNPITDCRVYLLEIRSDDHFATR